MPSFQISIQYGPELERKLRDAGPRIARKAVVSTFRREAKIIRDEAKSILTRTLAGPERSTGLAARSIKVRAAKRSRRWFGISVATGVTDYAGKAFYGAFREFGTGQRRLAMGSASRVQGKVRTRTFRHPGQPERPFLEPAFMKHGPAAALRVPAEIAAALESELAKGVR
jgi:HK97 gp10 family phage protein